jgi:NADH-quinone oxidoreductase subunit L
MRDDHGHGHHHHHEPHESPWVVTVPLVLLAIPSVVVGFMFIQPMLFGDFFKDVIFVDAVRHPAMAKLAEIFHGPMAMALHGLQTAPFWLALAGCWAVLLHVHGQSGVANRHQGARAAHLHVAGKQVLPGLDQRKHPGARCACLGHRSLEGRRSGHHRRCHGQRLMEAGSLISSVVRWMQTGFIFHYALVMILGVFALMTWFVWRDYFLQLIK